MKVMAEMKVKFQCASVLFYIVKSESHLNRILLSRSN
jgi:hypothetical protein